MIQLRPVDSYGGSDPDSQKLWEAMNVPEQGSMLGPGKAIKASDKSLDITCAKQTKGPQCTIMIHPSPGSTLSPSKKIIQYKVSGAVAEQIRSAFHLDENGEFRLMASDGYFKIEISEELVLLLFDGNGL